MAKKAKTIFRYPGGKSRVAKVIYESISNIESCSTYYEPMIGGGAVLLYVASQNPDIKLRASELNPDVAAFWKCVSDRALLDKLIKKILDKRNYLTLDLFNKLRNKDFTDVVDQAFKILAINKGSFNGYIFKGAVPVGGEQQKGKWKVDWCWTPERLVKRLEDIYGVLEGRFKIKNEDMFDSSFWKDKSLCVYLDPPYFKEGSKMYGEYGSFPHEDLSKFLKKLPKSTKWVLSYDDCPEVRNFYKWATINTIGVLSSRKGMGKKTDTKKTLKRMRELLVSSE